MFRKNRSIEVGQYNTPVELFSRMIYRSASGNQQEDWNSVGYLLVNQKKETFLDGVMKRPQVIFLTHKREDIYVGQRLRNDTITYEIDVIIRDQQEMELICKRI